MMPQNNVAVDDLDILIVEDDHMLNVVMCFQVNSAGYTLVRSAKSGQQALKMIEESVPSVLILDVNLGDMTAQELTEKLRRNPSTSSIPLIVHTTLDLSEAEETQLQLGPSRFVTKSTAFSERLGQLISEVTERASQ